MKYEFLEVEIKDRVATVTLNRPKVNALNSVVFREIGNCAVELQYNDDVRAVVITGGEKVFAAGADIKEMANATSVEADRMLSIGQDAFTRVAGITKPVIAAINGYALGGGLELCLTADWRFAGKSAQMGLPEIKLGIIPGAGGTQRLPRLIGISKAKEMIFSGNYYDAEKCLEYGLVDRIVDGSPIAEAQEVAREYAEKYPPVALAMAKRSVNGGLNCSLTEGLLLEAQSISVCFSTEDQKIGMKTFIEEGPGKAKFTGK